jgi:hypothetical protein
MSESTGKLIFKDIPTALLKNSFQALMKDNFQMSYLSSVPFYSGQACSEATCPDGHSTAPAGR